MSWRIETTPSPDRSVSFSDVRLEWFLPHHANRLNLLKSQATLTGLQKGDTTIYSLHFPHSQFYGDNLQKLFTYATGHDHLLFMQPHQTREGTLDDLRMPHRAKSGDKEAIRLLKAHGEHLGPPFAEFIKNHHKRIALATLCSHPEIPKYLTKYEDSTFTVEKAREMLFEEMEDGLGENYSRRFHLLSLNDSNLKHNFDLFLQSPSKDRLRDLIGNLSFYSLGQLFWATSIDGNAFHTKSLTSKLRQEFSKKERHIIDTEAEPYEEIYPFPHDRNFKESIKYLGEGLVRVSIGNSYLQMKEVNGKFKTIDRFIDAENKHALIPHLVWQKSPSGRLYLPAPYTRPANIKVPHNADTVLGLAAAVAVSNDFHLTFNRAEPLGHSRDQNIFEAQIGTVLLRDSGRILNDLPLFSELEKFADGRLPVSS